MFVRYRYKTTKISKYTTEGRFPENRGDKFVFSTNFNV